MYTYMAKALRKTLGEKKGVTALEYAIMAAAIAVAVVAAVELFGGELSTLFGTLTDYAPAAPAAGT